LFIALGFVFFIVMGVVMEFLNNRSWLCIETGCHNICISLGFLGNLRGLKLEYPIFLGLEISKKLALYISESVIFQCFCDLKISGI